MERVGKSAVFVRLICAPPPVWLSIEQLGGTHAGAPPVGCKQESGPGNQFLAYLGAASDKFLSCLTWSVSGIWKPLKTEVSSVLELQCYRQISRVSRDHKRFKRSFNLQTH